MEGDGAEQQATEEGWWDAPRPPGSCLSRNCKCRRNLSRSRLTNLTEKYNKSLVKWKSKCKKNNYHKNTYDKPEPYKLPIVYYKNICYKINVYFNSNSVLWYFMILWYLWVQDVNVLPFHYYNHFCQTKNNNLQHYLTIIWWFQNKTMW